MKKTVLIPLVSGIVVVAGIVSLYTQVWNPSWNPFVNPDEVLSEALEKMVDLKTYSQKAEISGSASGFEGLDNISFSFSIKTDTDVDLTLPENPKSSGDLQMDISFAGIPEQQLTPQITPFVTGGKLTLFLEAQMKQIGEESYFKMKTIPFYPFLNMQFALLGINLSEIKDNWIKIDPEAISQWTGVKYEGIDQEQTKKLQEDFKNILKEKKLMTIKKVLKNEKIDDVMCYHYLLSVEQNELKEVILETFNMFSKEYLAAEITPPEEALEEFYKEFDKMWEKLGGIEFEIWIGKKDKFIRLINLEKEIDLEKFAGEDKKISGKVNIKLTIGYSNLNQAILITAPLEYKNLEKILEPLLMKLMEFQTMQSIPTQ